MIVVIMKWKILNGNIAEFLIKTKKEKLTKYGIHEVANFNGWRLHDIKIDRGYIFFKIDVQVYQKTTIEKMKDEIWKIFQSHSVGLLPGKEK